MKSERDNGGRGMDPRYWQDLVVAADPGLSRLRMALRATSTAGIATGILTHLYAWLGLPSRISLIGVVVAMMGSVFVNDPEPRAQKITLALLALAAAAAVAVSSALAAHPALRDVVFIVLMYAAVAVRRFGPRGTALGMVGFLGFLFALFFQARLAQVPWMCVAIGVAMLCAYVVRFAVVRDDPERSLRWSERAFLARVRLLLRRLADAAADGRWHRRQPAIYHHLEQLNETALILEDALQAADLRSIAPELAPEDLRARIFDVELHAEQVAVTIRRLLLGDTRPEVRRALVAAILAARGEMRYPPETGTGGNTAGATEDLARIARETDSEQLRRLAVSLRQLVTATRLRRRPALNAVLSWRAREEKGEKEIASAAGASPGPPGGLAGYLHPTTRQALQAAVGGGLAILVGHLLSASRWYWAVIASFVVFTSTASRGEILLKGWYRIFGTLVGIGAGLAIADAVGGHHFLEIVLIFLGIFLGYYLFRISYAWMVGSITAVLALFYGIIGRPPEPLMLTRLEETVAGVAVSSLVAVLILPTGTVGRVRGQMAQVLRSLAAYLEETGERIAGGNPPRGPLHAARELDGKLRELRQMMRPLLGSFKPVRFPGITRKAMLISALVYYARNLAKVVEDAAGEFSEGERKRVREAERRLAGNLEALAASLEGEQPAAEIRPLGDLLDGLAETGRPPREQMAPHHQLSAGAIVVDMLKASDEIVGELGFK